MTGSSYPLKVSEELIKTYTQRRNSHLVSATGDGERTDEPDPYAFEEGDDEFSFDKKDKAADRDGSKKYKVGFRQQFNANSYVCVLASVPMMIKLAILFSSKYSMFSFYHLQKQTPPFRTQLQMMGNVPLLSNFLDFFIFLGLLTSGG